MISGYLKHFTSALTAIAALSLGGCVSQPDAPDPADPAGEIILRLKIACPVTGSNSRDLSYEDPENIDFEKISSLRVIIFNNVNGETGTVEANRLVRTDALGNPQYDNLRFRVIADQWKRIYLIANESSLSYPEATATQFLDSYVVDSEQELAPLIDWTVSLPAPEEGAPSIGLFYPASGITQIPLTESFDIFVERHILDSTTGLTEDYSDTDLFLTRAAAKASFYVNPASSREYTITALSLSGVGTEEYVFPLSTKYDPQKYDENGQVNVVANGQRYITEFETPSAPTTTFLVDGLTANLEELLHDDPKESVYIQDSRMYFPESILKSGEHYKVGVQIDGDIWLYADLETKDLNKADILNINGSDAIARDTHLKIDLTINDATLSCQVDVVPYIGIVLTPHFGFGGLLPGDHNQPADW